MDNLHGRPLLDVATDMDLFVDRPREMDALRVAARRGHNTLLVGAAGSGKTTLLRALMFRSRGKAPELVYVRAATADTAAGILQLVIRELRGHAHRDSSDLRELDTATPDVWALLGVLQELVGQQPFTVLLDDGHARPAHHLFGLLRDELWAITALHWVVALRPSDVVEATAPPAEAFFEARVAMRSLVPDQIRQIVRTRVGAAQSWEEEAGVPPEGVEVTPRLLLEGLRRDQQVVRVWESVAMQADRRASARALGQPAVLLFSELESLGPVALTDEQLMQRLGWSPSRVRQVAKRLEEANLIDHVAGHSSGPGRPPRLYHVVGVTPRELDASR